MDGRPFNVGTRLHSLRKSLAAAGRGLSWAAVAAALYGSLGCLNRETTVVPASAAAGNLTRSAKADKRPKKDLQPATCVAFAVVREQLANDPKRTPAERENLLEEARRAHHYALKLDPKHAAGHLGLARVYEAQGNHEKARTSYEQALQIQPKDAKIWCAQGMYLARQKNWEAALGSLRTACELDPDNRSYASALGFAYARSGRFDDSFAVFKIHLGDATAHYNVARMLHHVQQEERCQAHLTLALQSDPGFEPARTLQAELRGEKPAQPAEPRAADNPVIPAEFLAAQPAQPAEARAADNRVIPAEFAPVDDVLAFTEIPIGEAAKK